MTLAGDLDRNEVLQVEASGWSLRLLSTVAGGATGGLAAAVFDGAWAHLGAAGGATSVIDLVACDIGLLMPLAITIGMLVWVGALIVEPTATPPVSELMRMWRASSQHWQRRAAATIGSSFVGAVLWATLAAQSARMALASSLLPLDTGLLAMAGAVGFAVVVVVFILGVGFAGWSLLERWQAGVRGQAWTIALGVAASGLLLGYGIASGTTSGGNGLFGIWGVLKREELDLRASGLLLLITGAAYLLPSLLMRRPWLSWAIVVAPCLLLPYAALKMSPESPDTAALEAIAPLGKTVLRALRQATDRDHDGASALFGGGDCNDADPVVGPGAIDVPSNGIDEDCSGDDATAAAPHAQTKAPHAPSQASIPVPPDLNLILITVDTLRADLGYAGYPKPVSPHIDELAARSVVFERAYSLASYTGKSVGPLLSGKYPSETHRGWGHFNRYGKEDTMLAERLKAAGFHTLAAHAHWYFSPPYGLARGFDTWDMSAFPGRGHDEDATVTGDKLTDAAIRLLSKPEETSSRFFAWFHYFDPHSEYARHPQAPNFGSGQRALYDGEVWFTDQQIGRLLDFARTQPWFAKTGIVLTADHGEAFGEHNVIRHGVEIYEELVRVPLLFYFPGIKPHRISQRRSCIDLTPTLFDALHVMWPTGDTPYDFVSGQSLIDDLFPPPGYRPEERDVLIDMPAGPYNDERRALVSGDLKLYVANGVRFQLFDLASDPGETKDLSRDASLMGRMMPRYREIRAGLREVRVRPAPKEE